MIESPFFKELEQWFEYCKVQGEDIHEHMDTLRKYAEQSETIVELGVRKIITTTAFMLGLPKKLTSVDIYMPSYFLHDGEQTLGRVYKTCQDLGIDFKFICDNDLNITLDAMDLLFIDTDHIYDQLKQELEIHGTKAKKWIIMHDTVSYAEYITVGSKIEGGLKFAISEFLYRHPEWKIEVEYINNNGLTVLSRI